MRKRMRPDMVAAVDLVAVAVGPTFRNPWEPSEAVAASVEAAEAGEPGRCFTPILPRSNRVLVAVVDLEAVREPRLLHRLNLCPPARAVAADWVPAVRSMS